MVIQTIHADYSGRHGSGGEEFALWNVCHFEVIPNLIMPTNHSRTG